MLRRFSANNTHLYPGALLRTLDDGDPTAPSPGDDVAIEFSDGVIVHARWPKTDGDGFVLRMPAWRTEHGAEVAMRTWRVTPGNDADVLKIRQQMA